MIQQFHFVSKRAESRNATDEYIYVHSSIIHHSEKVEAIQVPTKGWMNKQNAVLINNGMLSCLKNKSTYYNMNKT